MIEGEFEKRMDELAFEIKETDLGRMVLPYGETYKLLCKTAKQEFYSILQIYRQMGYSMQGLEALLKKWFGE